MRKMTCRYPGDTPVTVVEMTKEEFLKRFPDRGTTITSQDPITGKFTSEYIPAPADQILCDACNANISHFGDLIYLYGGTRAYCPTCFKDSLESYCK